MHNTGISGFRGFFILWFGQFISLVGSSMTRFALTIWAYQETQSALALALVAVFSFGPSVIFSPVAGAMVDRWNRKVVMAASDLIAGFSTILLLVLFNTGELAIWHLYIVGFIASTADAFQFPAFSAAVTMMVDKKHYARASGMRSLAQFASSTAAPLFGGIALAAIGLRGVFLIDIVTFVFAVGALFIINIPQPKQTADGVAARGSLWFESMYGFRYIKERPPLLGMQLIFMMSNLFFVMTTVTLAPMILAKTNNDEILFGVVQSVMGIGGIAGGMLISLWGGPQRRVHGVFLGMAGTGLLGSVVIGLGDNGLAWVVGAFLAMFFLPLVNSSNQAIWQNKVAPDVQGRVFAVRRLIAQITVPLGMVIAGSLADFVFEPAMEPGAALADVFGGLVGTGPGAGIALLMVLTGILNAASGLSGYLFPVIRNVETLLPDFEAEPEPEEAPVTDEEMLPAGGDVAPATG